MYTQINNLTGLIAQLIGTLVYQRIADKPLKLDEQYTQSFQSFANSESRGARVYITAETMVHILTVQIDQSGWVELTAATSSNEYQRSTDLLSKRELLQVVETGIQFFNPEFIVSQIDDFLEEVAAEFNRYTQYPSMIMDQLMSE